jgi:hypothetical protein
VPAGAQVALSNDNTTLANNAATPAASLCATVPRPLAAPGEWFSADCRPDAPRTGRFLWYRNNAAANVVCPMLNASSPASCMSEGFAYLHIAEIAAYATRCPSLSNLAFSAGSSLVSGLLDGCGAATPGALNGSSAWSGSTCMQSCPSGTTRIRGGTPTQQSRQSLRCAAGEWLNDVTLIASGPHVCGVACPALGPPAWTSTSACRHIVAQESFDGAALQLLTDWYPFWRVFKVSSAAPLPLAAMEYRAVVEDGVLTLSGQRTLVGLNEPLWASSPSSVKVAADVRVGSDASVAGLALRIQPGVEPASFYLLKLVANAGADHQLVRVVGGSETILATAPWSACPVSTRGFQRVLFWALNTALAAYCNGTSFVLAFDFDNVALLTVGSAGVYAANPARSVNASAVFDNLLIERSCDWGVCAGALPGERCSWDCAFAPVPAAAGATCQPDGTWLHASACAASSGAYPSIQAYAAPVALQLSCADTGHGLRGGEARCLMSWGCGRMRSRSGVQVPETAWLMPPATRMRSL